jgi:tRNA(Ile)-lysidine synthase
LPLENIISSFLARFLAFVRHEHLYRPHDRLLVAVSGGVDSVVLCDLLSRCGHDYEIAHCNFNLRGDESDRDESFVRSLSRNYGKILHCNTFDTTHFAMENKCSIQEAARTLRYEWFAGIMEARKLEWQRTGVVIKLLTAHHLDDNVETAFMNFVKGTGIAGIRGMLPATDKVVRPLLFAGKDEIRRYADAVGLQWVEDSSNREDKYSRNFMRRQVLPLIAEHYPMVDKSLAENIARFRDVEILYGLSVERLKKRLLSQNGPDWRIPVEKLRLTPGVRTILWEIIRHFGFSARQIDEVSSLMDSETGRYVASSTHRILRYRNWLLISAVRSLQTGIFPIEESIKETIFPAGTLHFNIIGPLLKDALDAGSEIAFLDLRDIRYPLILRKWKHGDFFYPLGMRKKKKISRFLTDAKLSLPQKENVWVLESDKRIIWVVGMRPDDRFRIGHGTARILKIKWLKDQG